MNQFGIALHLRPETMFYIMKLSVGIKYDAN